MLNGWWERVWDGCERRACDRLALVTCFFDSMAAPTDFLRFVDINKDRFIERLGRAVEIPRYPLDFLAWGRTQY